MFVIRKTVPTWPKYDPSTPWLLFWREGTTAETFDAWPIGTYASHADAIDAMDVEIAQDEYNRTAPAMPDEVFG